MFLDRNKVGLILRVYASKENQIPAQLAMLQEAVERARAIAVHGKKLFSQIDILVWADQRFKDADCGKTAPAVREMYRHSDGVITDVFVSEVKHGDLYCGILNYGIAKQCRHRISHSTILSKDAFSYMNNETFESLVDAFENPDVRVAGVALNELAPSILEGRIANTFAMYDNLSLLTVGGFDFRAAKPKSDQPTELAQSWHMDKGQVYRAVYYHVAGVEEMIPLARLVDTFGPCVAPILPRGEGIKQYQVPDKEKEPGSYERHISKMAKKEERQRTLLEAAGYSLQSLKDGVIQAQAPEPDTDWRDGMSPGEIRKFHSRKPGEPRWKPPRDSDGLR